MTALARSFRVLSRTFQTLQSVQNSGIPLRLQKQAWSLEMLRILGVTFEVRGTPTQARPALFVGNHVSYLDILILLAGSPDLSFVAKEELARWPLFGRAMRLGGTVFVKRDSPRSRGAARETLRRALEQEYRAIAIFPSGTTTLHEEKPWKLGAFRLAAETGVPVQPFRLRYEPLRAAAFIDRDTFLPHVLGVCRAGRIRARIEFAPAEIVTDPKESCRRWHEWAADPRVKVPTGLPSAAWTEA